MRDWLTPDYVFEKFDDITPGFLTGIGIRSLLIDIDNTLAPYEQPDADARIAGWFASLRAAGIGAALISNNDQARVERFNAALGLPAYWKSGKPFKKNLLSAMTAIGAEKSSTAMLGDQLLTDALAGKHIGLRAIIVPPIRDRRDAFTRFKRVLEKPFLRRYRRLKKKRLAKSSVKNQQ